MTCLQAELERLRSGKKSNKRVKREQEVKQEKIVLDPNDIVDVTCAFPRVASYDFLTRSMEPGP